MKVGQTERRMLADLETTMFWMLLEEMWREEVVIAMDLRS